MKFLIISQYYPPEVGAAATRWSEYSQILQDSGQDVTILTELPNYPSGIIADGFPKYWYHEDIRKKNAPRIIRVPVWANPRKTTIQRLGFYVSFMITASLRALFLPRYDYIIVSSPPLFVGLIATLIKPFKKGKILLDLRDIWPESAYVLGEIKSEKMLNFGRFLERSVYSAVDAFLLAVPGFRIYLDKNHSIHLGKKKINLMNGVSKSFLDIVKQKQQLGRSEKFTVLFSGNIGLAQDLGTLLDAAQHLALENIEFKIIGDGAKRDELMVYAREMKLNNITFIPSMPRTSLIKEILSAHVCLVPLIKSPLFLNAIPSKLLEYMAAGRPVIVAIKGEVEDLILKSRGGTLVEPGDSNDLAKIILEYKNDPERGIQEGQAGQIFINKGLTKEGMMKDVLSALGISA